MQLFRHKVCKHILITSSIYGHLLYFPIKTKLKMNSLCNDGTLSQFIHTADLAVGSTEYYIIMSYYIMDGHTPHLSHAKFVNSCRMYLDVLSCLTKIK